MINIFCNGALNVLEESSFIMLIFVFAGKVQCKATPLDNVFTIRAKALFLVKLQCQTF